MRFKNLLGLLAIGGAVAYAQKKRGGDLSLAGIKNSLKGVVDNVKGRIEGMQQKESTSDVGTSDMGTSARSSIADDYASTSGYSQRSYSTNGLDTGNRKL